MLVEKPEQGARCESQVSSLLNKIKNIRTIKIRNSEIGKSAAQKMAALRVCGNVHTKNHDSPPVPRSTPSPAPLRHSLERARRLRWQWCSASPVAMSDTYEIMMSIQHIDSTKAYITIQGSFFPACRTLKKCIP